MSVLAISTPLVRLTNLFPDRQVYAKCEFLAPSGSFKIRGGMHLLEHLAREREVRQLVVPSMGNTALGAAAASRELGFSMVGVVPQTISQAKDERLQALGVQLIKVTGGGSELLRRARQIADDTSAYFVHPHLDRLWTDGYQGIAGEIFRDLPDCRSIIFPVGGGGLLMGLTEYLLQHPRTVRLLGCEAWNYPTYARFSHERSPTIADGLVLETPHPAVQKRIEDMAIHIGTLADAKICTAMAGVFHQQGWIVEPSSAITVALVQEHRNDLEEPIALILTGDNITRDDFYRLAGISPWRRVLPKQ
jgi:threonine dehydratase